MSVAAIELDINARIRSVSPQAIANDIIVSCGYASPSSAISSGVSTSSGTSSAYINMAALPTLTAAFGILVGTTRSKDGTLHLRSRMLCHRSDADRRHLGRLTLPVGCGQRGVYPRVYTHTSNCVHGVVAIYASPTRPSTTGCRMMPVTAGRARALPRSRCDIVYVSWECSFAVVPKNCCQCWSYSIYFIFCQCTLLYILSILILYEKDSTHEINWPVAYVLSRL